MDHDSHAEAARQAPSYDVAAEYFLWFARGSAGFINLGVHSSPPPPELELAIDYREIPNSLDFFTDTSEERLLKAAFLAKGWLDEWAPVSWP